MQEFTKNYNIVDVCHTRRYEKLDPFIIASSTRQVYYVPYLEKIKDKVQQWVVIKTKARSRVEIDKALETAFQDDNCCPVDLINEKDIIVTLCDANEIFKEVEDVDTSRQHKNECEEENV